MLYKTFLKNQNMSKNTINTYLKLINNWLLFINGKNPTKTLILSFIKSFSKNHKPNTIRVMYAVIISYLRFQKKYVLVSKCKGLKLPTTQFNIRTTIKNDEFFNVFKNINFTSWYQKRDWLIFSFLFFTGMRANELTKLYINNIFDGNKVTIQGKGSKSRIIYINNFLLSLLKNWKKNQIPITRNNKIISYKHMNNIIKKIGLNYFNKYITPHSLRRSYATNLLRSEIDIEMVRRILGHASITTTSRYIHYTDDEIIEKISSLTNDY